MQNEKNTKRNSKNGRTRVFQYEYDELFSDSLSKKAPKIADIKFQDGQIVYADFSKLDNYLETIFLPNNLITTSSKFNLEESISYVRLNTIIALNLCGEEIKYVFNYLNQKGIKISGTSSLLIGQFANYHYYDRSKNIIEEFSQLKFLNPEYQIELFKKYQKTHDIRIRNELVEGNMNLVYYVLKALELNKFHDDGDLISYGFEGLIKAVENFNLELGYTFSTFAYQYIKFYLYDGIDKKTSFKNNFYADFLKAKKIIEKERERKLAGDISLIDEIIDLVYATKKYNPNYRAIYRNRILLSICGYIEDNLDDESLIDSRELHYDVDYELFKEKFNQILSKLSESDLRILSLYYGLNGYQKTTISKIAQLENVSKQRISHRLSNILKKLRTYFYNSNLLEFTYPEMFDNYHEKKHL